MALQSSGQIKVSDIQSEIGQTASSTFSFADAVAGTYATINTASALYPNNSAPHQISEWYGYDHNASSYTNSHYLSFTTGDALRKTAFSAPFQLSGSQDLTVSMWIKKGTTSANEILFDMSATSSNTANRFFLQYHYSLNRFVARHRTNSTNYDRQWGVHDNNSSIGCGTSSGTKWSSTNRGNVNGDGWGMLTIVYDASQSNSQNGLKLYWNATEVTSQAGNNSGTRSTANVIDFTLGNNNHNPTTTAGGFNGDMDEVKIFTSALSSSDITSLYNSGVVADSANSFSTGLHTEFTFDTDTADSNGSFPTVQTSTATRTAY